MNSDPSHETSSQATNPLILILRWILVLPVSIFAFYAIQYAVALGNSIATGLPDVVVDAFCQFVNSIAGSFCFVFAGAKTAPSHQFIVAILLTVIHAVAIGVLGTLAFVTDSYHDSKLWLVIAGILGIAATIVACFHFNEMSRHVDDAA